MKTYIPSKPCRHGHFKRYVSNNVCCECNKNYSPQKNKWRQTQYKLNSNYKDNILTQNSEWKKANLEKIRILNNNRQAIKRGSEGSYTKEDVILILAEQGGKCPGCLQDFSEELPYSMDHFISLNSGGTNKADNIQLLCVSCNCSKRDIPWAVWFEQREAA